MANQEPKNTHGGVRQGAGRKPTGKKVIYQSTTISGLPEEIQALKELAKANKKTLSRFVIESLIK